MTLNPATLFALLGPAFLALGAWRCARAGRLVPQARAWLIIGAVFSAVALWLWAPVFGLR